MEIIKPQLQITLNKTELNALIAEALENPETSASLKRVLSPLLEGKFPQFPEFVNITLGDTAEDGSTLVTLKKPREVATKSDTPIQSMEPLEVADKQEEPVESQPYIEPAE